MIEYLIYYLCLFMFGIMNKNRFIEYINLLYSLVIKKKEKEKV